MQGIAQHDDPAELIRRLGKILPPELAAIRLAGSGDAANDLALRLARAYTGAADVVVVDHADHGALPDLAAISPYRFDAPGGTGRPGHVWVAEMPDPYRGRLREGDKDIGAQYAESVATLVMDMVGLGRKPMTFIAAAVQESGGVIPFPAGYLEAAYKHVRREGGLCIADEVGFGMGRAGSHWWAFETQGVVPDIVTIGGIGDGVALAAVATRPEIAAALAHDMTAPAGIACDPATIADEMRRRNALERGRQLLDGLRALARRRHRAIGDVRGLGLCIGVEFVTNHATLQPDAGGASRLAERMNESGFQLPITGQHRNVLAIRPPMTINATESAQLLSTFETALTGLGL